MNAILSFVAPWRLGRNAENSADTEMATLGPADPLLMGTIIGLVAFGVVMVYSASAVFAERTLHDGTYFLVRQGSFAIAGLLLAVALARFDYHRIRPLTYPIFIVSIGLLAYVALGFGHTVGGAARWIRFGPIGVQPAEVSKLALIIWLSYSLSKKSDRVRTFSIGFLPHILAAGGVILLCLRQPDFGSSVMIALLTFILLFAAGARTGYMLGAVLIAAPIGVALVTGSEYRMRRIRAFLDPFAHRYDVGYQISESLMSFGAGGVSGLGLGDSRQKLFIPEAHNDFIGAIVGEELGFIGVVTLVVAYGIVLWRGTRAAMRATDEYGSYLAFGTTAFICLQAFTNLAVAMGLLPTKGLTLPFISYGGSSLLVNCAAAGLLLNVSRSRAVTATTPAAEPETQRLTGAKEPA